MQGVVVAGTLLLPALWAVDAPLTSDTYISTAATGSNFGVATNMIVLSGNSGLVQFDLSSVPPSSTVTAAYLVVYANKVLAPGTLNFAVVTSPWTELGVTAGSPPSTNAPFASIPATVGNSFLIVDVTAAVQGWLATPASNFGIEITGAGSVSVQLDTKENTATSHPAQLALTVLGPAGPAGAPGQPGLPGSQGAPGPAGATGVPGSAGPAGPTGPTGAVGATGPSGAQGAAGLAGALGPTGPTGAVGATGLQGDTGAAGLAGAAGPKGATGSAGPPGSAGATGPTGIPGAAGPSGASGANGPTSNVFSMDTTLHGSGFTIPDSSTFLYYLMNNVASSFATVNLPHATVAGKMVVILPANAAASSGITAFPQSGDTLIGTTGSVASVVAETKIMALSDGNHKWYVLTSAISQ